ncbi:hypothetical protein QL285_060814 [Trifolium repens]|nr:hypothetical protein QL285_060814 [Trifolium repens]
MIAAPILCVTQHLSHRLLPTEQVPYDNIDIHNYQLGISARVTNKPRTCEERDTKIPISPSNRSHTDTDYRDTTQLQSELHIATLLPSQIQINLVYSPYKTCNENISSATQTCY